MLRELAGEFPEVRATFAAATQVLNYDLWELAQNGPEIELNRTERTQPLMLAAGVAVWRVWRANGGGVPAVMAGHSLGEYTALVCAGALDFTDAVALVAARGRFMQEAVPEEVGAMAVILGLADEKIADLCAEISTTTALVSAVNFNSPEQVVIAGHRAAVVRTLAAAKAQGAKRAMELPVSVPSHCALMRGAALRLRDRLAQIPVQEPQIPVINNVDVSAPREPAAIREALVRQLYSPVRWIECIREMAQRGITTLIEAGPGKVLTGLGKRIEKRLVSVALGDPAGLRQLLDR